MVILGMRCPCVIRDRHAQLVCQRATRAIFFTATPGKIWASLATRSDATVTGFIAQHGDEIAGLILEPVVQGAGGMYFLFP
ncbi:adenosylmethionine--8-amino-7-oxononanoate transaminase [Mannheimia haemolytica]|uniref:Adenosylmethionine--8-amino-7-oxononanoate transaminase n=1 Tax=Mannheimia haemolytica TaxID=75985 RepID=A0A378MXU4_MANHA|nr:adenosylmethionine--8-amino-7-oxononanoate transaminase [Mannheimia haemolytica]